MSVLLVTYDLYTPGQNYDEVLKYLKSHPCEQVSKSCYVIETTKSPKTVRNALKKLTDENDVFYVFRLIGHYAGYGPETLNAWLNSRL